MRADETDLTEVVIVLNSDDAVKAFSRGGNVTVGGQLSSTLVRPRNELTRIGGVSVAAGPIGTGGQVNASLANPAPMFSYSRSKGTSRPPSPMLSRHPLSGAQRTAPGPSVYGA